ncbi:MFS transporter (plasmid) [Mycolicibacterium arabiense]|uniref:Putative proline/betaine transporter n=1 Tax=Mycolicibacterium arabiense TaxID=1286181 RepID=A0A7I7RR20_9MYCO|nr:MFS transporter [Mycolicibacterium arabiense]
MIGTTIEFYDFYVYATASVLVFPQVFFPTGDSTTALLASLATFGLAFVARPVGSVVFGHFGDRIGRKSTLVASLLLMGAATFGIGLLPTYAQVGVVAPILLATLRFTQGLALGGEWSGAALLAIESAPQRHRGWAAMWPQLGAPAGFLLANGSLLVLLSVSSSEALLSWAWRIPFLLSAAMVAVGLYVRLRLTETPVFARSASRGDAVRTPKARLLSRNGYEVVVGTFAVVSTFTIFYVVTTWTLSYGTAKSTQHGLGFGFVDFLRLQLIAVLFFAAAVPLAGRLIDRFGRRPILLCTSVAIAYGTSFGFFLDPARSSSTLTLTFLILGMALVGLAYGPLGAVLPEMFPTNVRYTGSGVSFNLASILGAAVAPFIATWLTAHHGSARWVCTWWSPRR